MKWQVPTIPTVFCRSFIKPRADAASLMFWINVDVVNVATGRETVTGRYLGLILMMRDQDFANVTVCANVSTRFSAATTNDLATRRPGHSVNLSRHLTLSIPAAIVV
jgi:hypothetical protein